MGDRGSPHVPHPASLSAILQAITNLKQLCNHPKLIYDALLKGTGKAAAGFEVRRTAPMQPQETAPTVFWQHSPAIVLLSAHV